MVHVGVGEALRERGVDAEHVLDTDHRGAGDREILERARKAGRVVATRNYRDYAPLAAAYAERGIAFPGVLFLPTPLPQRDVGEQARRIEAWVKRHREGPNPVENTFGWA